MRRGWVFLGACLLCAGLAHAERTLEFTVDDTTAGAPSEVPVYFDQRLTVVMPGPVRMAVPGSPDVLVAHARENVVVVTLIDSPFVRQTRPVTNLTIIGEGDLTFTARVTVAESADAAADLVKITRGAGLARRASAEALAVLRAWLTEGPAALDAETATALEAVEPLIEARARRRVAAWAAEGGVEALDAGTHRNKAGFIYLTGHGLVRVGPAAVLQATVTNHSQPTFTVDRVRLTAAGAPVAPAEITWAMPDPVVPEDGAPRALGVYLPARVAVGAGALELEVCDGSAAPRCVSVPVR